MPTWITVVAQAINFLILVWLLKRFLYKPILNAIDERQRLLDEARKDDDLLRAKRQQALVSEQRNLSQEIGRWTQKEVFAITRKTLTDLASTSLEERIGAVFVQRLRALTGAAREQLA